MTLEQRKQLLRRGVGLGQSGDAGLQLDGRLGEVGGFLRDVGIANLRFSGLVVSELRLSEVGSVLELILTSANGGLRVAEDGD